MGRFAAAKVHPLSVSEKTNRSLNQLIDLLDKAYVAELSIDGKKVIVEVSPTNGLLITVDGVKVAGLDSDGNFIANRLADPELPQYYLTLVNDSYGGHGIQLWDADVATPFAYFNVYENAAGGFNIRDKNDTVRIHIVPDNSVSPYYSEIGFSNSIGDTVLSIYDARAFFWKYIVADGELYIGTTTGGVPDTPHRFILATGYIQAGTPAYPENMYAQSHISYSDATNKENIVSYDSSKAYDVIKSIPVYSFNFINDALKRTQIGTTYQDAPKEICFTDIDEDILGVDNGNALFLAISTIQKLQEKIEVLETKVKDLEARLEPSV